MMLVGHGIVMCRIDIKLMLLLKKVIDTHGCRGLSVGQEISRHFAFALHFDLATAIELVSLSILQNVINFLGL